MSATETSTIPLPSTDSYTSIDRVAQIPFIHDMLSAVISALEANAYTRYGYGTAKDLSATVYKYAQPYEPRFAPVLHTADGFANKTLDTVQGKFPDAFVAKPEDLVSYVRDSVNARRDSVSKVIDLRVKTPAVAVAENVDRGCTRLVDAFETVVTKTSDGKSTTPIDAKYQYQRAFALSVNLKDNVYGYSADQMNQIQTQNALVQRAISTAQSFSQTASSSLASAQVQVKQRYTNAVSEFQNVQASTTALLNSLRTDATSRFHSQRATVQQALSDASAGLSRSISDLQAILQEDLSAQEKVAKLATQLQEQTTPHLEALRNVFASRVSTPTEENQPQVNGIH